MNSLNKLIYLIACAIPVSSILVHALAPTTLLMSFAVSLVSVQFSAIYLNTIK